MNSTNPSTVNLDPGIIIFGMFTKPTLTKRTSRTGNVHRPPAVNNQGKMKIAKNRAMKNTTMKTRTRIVWGEEGAQLREDRVDIGGSYSFSNYWLDDQK